MLVADAKKAGATIINTATNVVASAYANLESKISSKTVSMVAIDRVGTLVADATKADTARITFVSKFSSERMYLVTFNCSGMLAVEVLRTGRNTVFVGEVFACYTASTNPLCAERSIAG
jgi:hypothetical protein